MADGPSSKAASFLSSLKSGKSGGSSFGGLGGLGAGPASSDAPPSDNLRPMQKRIDELEKRLAEVIKATGGPEDGEAPKAPSELMMYIHTRMELLERKLQEAQAEALRANLLLHEREEAQRRAQKEVEDLFRTIKEQQRAARFDSSLREQVSGAQKRMEQLETQLAEAQLKMMPIEDVQRALAHADDKEALRNEVEERVKKFRESQASAEPAGPSGAPKESVHDIASDTGTVLMLTARLADLEHALGEAHRERDEERSRRAQWEREIVASFSQSNERWKKSGGVEITVQAALETMALALKERDAAEAELKDALEQAQSQPPGSPADPVLRARITAAQDRLDRLQATLQQQLAVVQAWTAQNP